MSVLDFPADGNELLMCKAAGFSPDNVIMVIPKEARIPTKESESSNTNKLNEVNSYFENKTMVRGRSWNSTSLAE